MLALIIDSDSSAQKEPDQKSQQGNSIVEKGENLPESLYQCW